MENGASEETFTFGMGCFWSPEALFGAMPGVVRTRVGYAGGTTDTPTYREMGDHSETVEVVFDPDLLPIETLLDAFWRHHKPGNINDYSGRQYMSLLFYRDEKQRAAMQTVKHRLERELGELATEIAPYAGFTVAEEHHQMYYLKRYPDAVAKLRTLFPSEDEWQDGTLAARLNGLAKGYTNRERIEQEIGGWPVDDEERERMLRTIRQIRW
ncbi:peptide-methionine (S)-S-oxide reductase MsrA [Cohnella sp. REN36]|uniref:peptide-methionine (S)-S-oxide reductase MsrA n=1 Tax=Cohnella sp. REN36 TaxID=2887347 RepID=UPI001D14816A|nr:peptide-methionine (S)-S-oxide reductase MsrA [Cohnella sp. REN36]MCC3374537.1 peptide-methionine (S)-S-oxide reductase MsrA [Cohnella sp. REN36]